MGPLTHMYMLLKRQNDEDYRLNGGGMDRALFNSRLSQIGQDFPTGRMPGDDGGPIILGEDMRPIDAMELRMLPGPASAPTPTWRDAAYDAGPSPPTREQLSMMLRRGR